MSDSAQESQKRHFSKIRPHVLAQQSGQQLRILALPSRAQSFELPLIAEGASRPSAASNAHGDRACLEQAVSSLNRLGFPNRHCSDSTCWLGGGQQGWPVHIRKTCDRVIDAVVRGGMSRRAAAARFG